MKTPKLARDLAALVGIARKETDSAKIEAALAEARSQIEAATREREDASDRYRDGLLDATPEALAKMLADRDAATIRLDRGEALVAALTQRLGMAREAEALAERRAVHAAAFRKCEDIRGRFREEYVSHASALRGLVRDLAEAEKARLHAEKVALDIGYIEPPEAAIRHLSRKPEEIVDTEVVELWAVDGRTGPLAEDQQRQVRTYADRPNQGVLTIPSSGSFSTSGGLDCTRRPFRRITYRPAETSICVESLFRTLSLPPVEDGASAFYTGSEWQNAEGALTQLVGDVAGAPRRELERPTSVRWEQIARPHPSAIPPANVRLVGPGRNNLTDAA